MCHDYLLLFFSESLDTIEELPWFPRNLQDLDECSKNVLMYGSELDHPDHPVSIYYNWKTKTFDL